MDNEERSLLAMVTDAINELNTSWDKVSHGLADATTVETSRKLRVANEAWYKVQETLNQARGQIQAAERLSEEALRDLEKEKVKKE